jgi:hypothetical protein
MKRIAVAGASECGKTTLVINLSKAFWKTFKMPTLALDPWKSENAWGSQAWVTDDEGKFWDAVWKKTGCFVVVDEASSTIARDRELIPAFTKIRHQGHTLAVVCHDATDLLPTMRRNLNEVFLFFQSRNSIPLWQQDLPAMKGLEAATDLQKYEFIHCKNFSEAKRLKLKL